MAITKATASSIAPAAKGDLVVGSATNDAGVLAVGTNTHILVADSTETLGMKWAAPAGASFVGCLATTNGTQTLANATETIVTFATEEYDTDGFHSTVTNTGRITIPAGKGGKYLFTLLLRFAGNATGQRNAKLFKNGNEFPSLFRNILGGTTEQIFTSSWQMNLVATDYIEIKALQSSGGNLDLEGGSSQCQFGCIYLGA